MKDSELTPESRKEWIKRFRKYHLSARWVREHMVASYAEKVVPFIDDIEILLQELDGHAEELQKAREEAWDEGHHQGTNDCGAYAAWNRYQIEKQSVGRYEQSLPDLSNPRHPLNVTKNPYSTPSSPPDADEA